MSRPRGPRIRTLKPELWQDERIGKLSRDARLLFIGLITMADDEGRLRAMPALILGHVFPYDLDAVKKLGRWLRELDVAGIVRSYEAEGVPYVAIPHWERHQKVSHPLESELPAPAFLPNASGVSPEAFQNASASSVPRAREGARGSDRIGSDHPPQPPVGGSPVDLRPAAADVRRIFDTWQASKKAQTGRPQTAVLDAARRKLIERALRSHPLDDLIAAVQGWRGSPFHCGANDTATVHNDLSLLLRNAGQIEKFRDLHTRSGNGATDLETFHADAERAQQSLRDRIPPRPPEAA